ncbi:hypothetical protein C8Q73DRAFT_490623 [Cubamyces lactineus]|nr:hypothetical protein C8Q73DRAFT_490623 [Cubamyces lactineus]
MQGSSEARQLYSPRRPSPKKAKTPSRPLRAATQRRPRLPFRPLLLQPIAIAQILPSICARLADSDDNRTDSLPLPPVLPRHPIRMNHPPHFCNPSCAAAVAVCLEDTKHLQLQTIAAPRPHVPVCASARPLNASHASAAAKGRPS